MACVFFNTFITSKNYFVNSLCRFLFIRGQRIRSWVLLLFLLLINWLLICCWYAIEVKKAFESILHWSKHLILQPLNLLRANISNHIITPLYDVIRPLNFIGISNHFVYVSLYAIIISHPSIIDSLHFIINTRSLVAIAVVFKDFIRAGES